MNLLIIIDLSPNRKGNELFEEYSMSKINIFIIALSLIVIGCGILTGIGSRVDTFDSNGARIYFTGTTLEGKAISYSGGAKLA